MMADGGTMRRDPLPINAEAEQAILGMLMRHPRALDAVGDRLGDQHFAHEAHARIFRAIRSTIERGGAPDVISIGGMLDADPIVREAGGRVFIDGVYNLALGILPGPSLRQWVDDVILRWKQRRAIELAYEMADVAYSDRADALDEMLPLVQRTLDDIAAGGNAEPYRHIGEWTSEAIAAADRAHKNKGVMVGVSTGLRDLDECTGGFQAGDLVVVGARPGMGKSAFCVGCARSAARAGKTVAIWSLEMPGEQVAGRMVSIDTRIPYAGIRRGALRDDDWPALLDAEMRAANLPIYVDATPAIRLGALASRARRIKRRHGLDLIVIDYLQLMRGDTQRRDGNRILEVSEITAGLKALAKDLAVPVLALSQLNRAVEARDDKRPGLSDLRESGSIEQDADIVMFLYREEYYLQKEGEPKRRAGETDGKFGERLTDYHKRLEKGRGTGDIIVAKQRNGPERTIRAAFNAQLMEYSDLYEQAPHQRQEPML